MRCINTGAQVIRLYNLIKLGDLMNRKFLMVVMLTVLMTVFGLTAYAQEINVWVGYGFTNMGSLNNFLKLSYTLNTIFQSNYSGSCDFLVGGINLGVQATYPISGELSGGFAVSYQSSSGGYHLSGVDFEGYNTSQDLQINLNLTPIMAGFSYTYPIDKKITITPGIYAGYGFLSGETYSKYESNNPSSTPTSYSASCQGGGFVLDIPIELKYKLSSNSSLSLRLGYRSANITNVKEGSDYALWSADFSGFFISASGGFKF
jgi:hypothetical protein